MKVYFMQDGKPVEIKRSTELNIKLSKEEEEKLRQIVIDPSRCPRIADEFSLYEHEIDKRTGEIMTGYPDGQPDHGIDTIRYALEEIWRHGGE